MYMLLDLHSAYTGFLEIKNTSAGLGFVDMVQSSGMASISIGVDPKDIACNVIELKRKILICVFLYSVFTL